MTDYIQVLTTFESQEDGETLAANLLEAGLAGCVQIHGPVISMYRWQGEVVQSEEYVCAIKSRNDLYPELEEAIRAMHPYEVPEIVAMPIHSGNGDYLHWLDGELKESGDR